jgi:ABC-type Fe3+ transport system permease subunit
MTLAAACGWSFVRSLVVALVAWPVCRRQSQWLSEMRDRSRRWMWIVVMVPFLCPELWIGYGWSGFGIRLAGTGFWNVFPSSFFPNPQAIIARDAAVDEMLLDLLLFFRAVPVGTLAMYFAPPPPLSLEAIYCRDLACRMGFPARPSKTVIRSKLSLGWFRFAILGRWHTALPALALLFLVSFQNFELASLIGRPAWTVWLFDAQVGGLALRESLRLTVLPVVCQLGVLLPIAWWIITSRSLPATRRSPARPLSPTGRRMLPGILAASLALTVLVPLLLVGQGMLQGLARVFQNPSQWTSLLKEILAGTAYGLTAAVACTFAAHRIWQAARRSPAARCAALAFSLPGLFGSLVLGLALIRLWQQPVLYTLYKTPPAFAAGLALLLFPRALALRFLLSSRRRRTGAHLAKLLGQSRAAAGRGAAGELLWQLQRRGEFWSVALLTYWAYLDLTAAYLLAPVTIVSAPVMLYNQMHFGKNATLSALVLLTVLVPALLFVLASVSRRFLFRWFWRCMHPCGNSNG